MAKQCALTLSLISLVTVACDRKAYKGGIDPPLVGESQIVRFSDGVEKSVKEMLHDETCQSLTEDLKDQSGPIKKQDRPRALRIEFEESSSNLSEPVVIKVLYCVI